MPVAFLLIIHVVVFLVLLCFFIFFGFYGEIELAYVSFRQPLSARDTDYRIVSTYFLV